MVNVGIVEETTDSISDFARLRALNAYAASPCPIANAVITSQFKNAIGCLCCSCLTPQNPTLTSPSQRLAYLVSVSSSLGFSSLHSLTPLFVCLSVCLSRPLTIQDDHLNSSLLLVEVCLDPFDSLSCALSPLTQCLMIHGCFETSSSGIRFSGSRTSNCPQLVSWSL